MKLQDKVAIVTGASSGMGREIAWLFASEGAKVIALARRKERLDELAANAAGQGKIIHPIQCDLAIQADIDQAFAQTMDKFGTVDILVNNAGIVDNMVPVHELTDELWDRVISVNLTSLMRLSRAAVNEFLKKEAGVIVNIASVGGLYGCRAGSAYTASKHGVIGLTKNIGFMYADKGIRCNAICPGGVETEISAVGINQPSQFGLPRMRSGTGTNPRIADAREIATVALFLASDDASFINGTTVTADAGWTAY